MKRSMNNNSVSLERQITARFSPDAACSACWKKVYRRSTQNNERHKMLRKKFARSTKRDKISTMLLWKALCCKRIGRATHMVEVFENSSIALSELRPTIRTEFLNYSTLCNINEAEAPHRTSALLLHPRSRSFVCTHSRLAHATSNWQSFSQRVHLLHHRPPKHLFFLSQSWTRFCLTSRWNFPFHPHRTQYGARLDNVFQFAE